MFSEIESVPIELTQQIDYIRVFRTRLKDVYQTPNHFQALLSVFFIDTAHNVAEYIEKFYQILSPGE